MSGPSSGRWRAGLTACLLLTGACAGARLPVTEAQSPTSGANGYRALFRGDSQRPGGRSHFRMAVAMTPPDRLRLEFFGPAGGPRLILAVRAESSLVLLPAERAFDRAGSSAEAVDRFLGVPLDAPGMIALLTGQPMCAQDVAHVEVMTRPGAAFGRTLSWYRVTCPPAEIRYEARCEERGDVLQSAIVREGISGAIILEAEYGEYKGGNGSRWPRKVRLSLPSRMATIQLSAVEGPWASDVPEAVFAPDIPDGFEVRPLALFPSGPGLSSAEVGAVN